MSQGVFNIIRPTAITDAMFHSSNIPETDYGEYSAGTTYADGDHAIESASGVHRIYESLQNGNVGNALPVLPATETAWWLEISATNRWKAFDAKLQSQSSQAESLIWVLNPGRIDSLALLNLDATETQIIMADQDTDLVTNGDDWTGATGTTQPTGWDKVGTPSNFLIDSGALKITADASNEGISQTVTVTPETEYQLLGIYRNTAGDLAQYAVYDVTHSADILATTDLASSTVESTLSYVFTAPAGCTSVRISLMAKASTDIVWFDTVSLAEVNYNETTTLLSTIAVIDWYSYFFEPIVQAIDVVKTDLAAMGTPPISTNSVTIIVSYAGGTAKCGAVVMGLKFDIGQMKTSPSVGIVDYSVKTVDDFGNYTITERSYSKRMNCELIVMNTILDEMYRQLALYRATPLVYVGNENYTSLIIYGFYKSFEVEMDFGPNYSLCSLDVEGLT